MKKSTAKKVIPAKALVKTIKVALQTLSIDADLVKKVTEGKLKAGPVLTVEPRRRKFHKLINLTIPSPVSDKKVEGLRLLYSLTEGNDRAEWEDLTDSVDFQVTDNGSVSFMTNVSARFWVVQILDMMNVQEVEPLASQVGIIKNSENFYLYNDRITITHIIIFPFPFAQIRFLLRLQQGKSPFILFEGFYPHV
jgi:hypothetical protein